MSARIGRNIFSLGISRIISGTIVFFVYILLTNYLGRDRFGQYSLVLAYYLIFSLLVDLGIARYVIKRVSENENETPLLTGNFVIAQLFISVLVFLIFAFLPQALHYEPIVRKAMLVAGLGLFINSLSSPFSAVVQAHERIHIVAGVNFLNTLINALWMGAAIIWRLDLVFLFSVYALIGILDVVLYYRFSRAHARPVFSFDLRLLATMIMYGLPFAFISGFEIVIAKIDVVIQKFFLPYAQIGLYSAAYKLVDILTFVPAVVSISLFPYFAKRREMKTEAVQRTINGLNRYLVALAIPMGVGGTLLADKIVQAIYTPEFSGAILPLQILIWASVLTFIYAVPNILMIVKRVKRSIYILVGITLFNAITNYIFIPRYGILASAWITVLSYLIYAWAYTRYSREVADFELSRYFFWPVAASLVMGAGIYLLRGLPLAILVALGVVIYAAVLIGFKFLRRDDWLFLKSIFAKSVTSFQPSPLASPLSPSPLEGEGGPVWGPDEGGRGSTSPGLRPPSPPARHRLCRQALAGGRLGREKGKAIAEREKG